MSPQPADLDRLEERVIQIIARERKLPPGQVTLDSTFEELDIDSLSGAELIFEFEEAFDLTISDEAARNMKSVRQAVEALRAVITAPPAPAEPA